MCTPVTPAVPYLLLGLQDIQWAVGNSRGARKLARTPHANQKKKNTLCQKIYLDSRRQKLESFPTKQPFELAQHKKTQLCMI